MTDETSSTGGPSARSPSARRPSPSLFALPVVAGIGNAIMAEPLVRQLRDARPDARIVIAAMTAPMAAVFSGVPRVETFVTGRGAKRLFKGARRLRAMRPDAYVVPFPSNRWQYNLLAAASGARRVIAHGYPVGRLRTLAFLHPGRVPAVRGLHDVEQNLRLLGPLGITPEPTRGPFFPLTGGQVAAARRTTDALDVVAKRFAVIHAGSANTLLAAAKRWATQNYADLAERIVAECDLDVLVLEGPDEAGVSGDVVGRTANRHRIHAAKLTGPLGESAALLALASFYAGTDSGLAHLAAAVGTPAVTLFAPADPDRVCPYGYRDLVVQPPDDRASTFLYPYRATRPRLPKSEVGRINTITVERVMEKVRRAQQSAANDGLLTDRE